MNAGENMNCVSLPRSNERGGFEACFLQIHVCAWRAFLWRGSTVPAILNHHGCSLVALQEFFFLPSEEYGSCPLLSPTESDRETPRGLYTHGLTLPIWKPFFSLTGTVGILCKMREKLEGTSIDSPYNDCPVSQKLLHLPSCQVSFHLGRNSLHSG